MDEQPDHKRDERDRDGIEPRVEPCRDTRGRRIGSEQHGAHVADASELASGITSGGKESRRSVGPLDTIDGSAAVTASATKV